jgi:hypothetical protein
VWNSATYPTAKFTFEGPPSGVGARWKWKGEEFQEDELEIVDSRPRAGVRYALTMADGMRVDGEIAFEPGSSGTRVTWTDPTAFGMGPLGGWMRLVLGRMIDREQGENQVKGLSGLKRRVEGERGAR